MSHYLSRLTRWAREQPTQEAICSDTQSISYIALMQRVGGGAAALTKSGIGEGSVVGLMIEDEVEHLVATLSLLYVGAWQIILATHDTAHVRVDLAKRIGASHVVTTGGMEPPQHLSELGWTAQVEHAAIPVSERGGLFLRTSGTTGGSNIVPLTSEELAIQSARHPEYASGRHLRLASVEHNNSKRHRLYSLYMGSTVVLRPKAGFNVAAYCSRHRVTGLEVSAMHAADLASDPAGDLSGVQVSVSGSGTSIAVRRRIQEHVSRNLFIRYGATEAGTIAICGPEEHDDDEPVGPPIDGIAVEIVDDVGNVLPRGEVGQIRLSGMGIAAGYLDNPEQTARRFRDGWFWPGDVGLLRPDGRLVLKGRADEMIILNGINIFPAELERVLEEHPDVRAAAATALRSAVHGDIPVAAVELQEWGNVSPLVLMKYARQRLALRAPRRIVIVSSLPRNAQGKLLRREVARIIDADRKTK